ncbi:tetratricopeptide repeat protein [Rosenbergiella sp. S61]|uniref:Tetratricopeptide repeat protein n=1 Tax=Rosenbergiella gaditana TaxID=2726987 RepID=A0ABS5SSR2_9GAMM|nr:tetratricopeptide repeat protein [Rosenbergiella gaditana]MBT0723109.1 tetratricopeptide repeat protein [Rosenbergiella gaditana]
MTDAHLLPYAITLRKNKHYTQSRQRLFSLLTTASVKGLLFLHIAWAYDNEGREEQAFDYYQRALSEPLSADDEFEATFGLACTARCLGKLSEAETLFKRLLARYPERSEIIPFYALCAMALNKASLASDLLLSLIINHPPTEAIAVYQKTLAGYWDSVAFRSST